jgi:hypothetical protein
MCFQLYNWDFNNQEVIKQKREISFVLSYAVFLDGGFIFLISK